MSMPPRIRKLALIVHLTVTLGWLGAVIVFLALAVIGLTSSDDMTARAAYLVMVPAGWAVLVPLAVRFARDRHRPVVGQQMGTGAALLDREWY